MNIEQITWNKQTYQNFLMHLLSLQDSNYQAFQSKLIADDIPMIGIRIPILRQLAKQINKKDYQAFLRYNTHHYYEEILLHGMVLGYAKMDFQTLLQELDSFLPYNTNWAINDTVCSSLKSFKKNQELGFQWILKLLKSNQPWNIRFGFILLLSHYMNEQYIDEILNLSCKTYPDYYYINMGIAWTLSICYIKFKDKTKPLLESKTLSAWIQNKTISKIRDSYQVSKEEKDYLKTLIK